MSTHAAVVKKFINDPEMVVPEALAGIATAHAGLVRVDLENQLVIRADAPVQDSLYTAGRRGTGATVLAEKIAGAKAEAGGSLAEVAGICRKVNEQGRSFGVALTSCATPSSGTPIFDLGPDEIEVGVGIHGEPGRRREKMKPAAEIAEEM